MVMKARRRRTRNTNALTAAATQIQLDKTFRSTTNRGGKWQTEAWHYYDSVGELQYFADWLASAVSRVRITAYTIDPETGEPDEPAENQRVNRIAQEIGNDAAARARLLYRLAIYLTIPGEGYLALIVTDQDGGNDTLPVSGNVQQQWLALSADEITASTNGDVTIDMPDGSAHEYDPARDMLIRIWNQHPQKARDATSPVRAALGALREVERATTRIDNASRSRMAGNGVMFLPQEMNLPGMQPAADDPDDPPAPRKSRAEDLQDLLFEVATTATRDPDSLAAFLPVMATVPGDQINAVKHLRFDDDVSGTSLTTRDSAIRRLAMSLNISPERLLGLGGSTHWNAASIDRNDIRVHVAPVVETICAALTDKVLRPILQREGITADNYAVWYDPSPLTQDPDKTQQAIDAFDRGALTAEALLEHLGFTEADGYDLTGIDGWQQWARDQAAANPQLVPMLAPLLGDAVADVEPAGQVDTSLPQPGTRSSSPNAEPGETASAHALLRLCVNRALEMSTKRRRTRADHALLEGVPPHEAHTRLGPLGAEQARETLAGWAASVPDEAIQAAGIDTDALTRVVQRISTDALTRAAQPRITDDDVAEVTA